MILSIPTTILLHSVSHFTFSTSHTHTLSRYHISPSCTPCLLPYSPAHRRTFQHLASPVLSLFFAAFLLSTLCPFPFHFLFIFGFLFRLLPFSPLLLLSVPLRFFLNFLLPRHLFQCSPFSYFLCSPSDLVANASRYRRLTRSAVGGPRNLHNNKKLARNTHGQ